MKPVTLANIDVYNCCTRIENSGSLNISIHDVLETINLTICQEKTMHAGYKEAIMAEMS
jgi:hypothetical protein